MFLILFGIPVCLLPLATYLLVLAVLNHRRPPTVASGAWDFAGALLGLSGFLVFGGPVLLTGFEDGWRRFWLRGGPVKGLPFNAGLSGWLISVYFLVLFVGVGVWLLWRRRRTTVIYNVRPEEIAEAVNSVLERMGKHWTQGPGHYLTRTPSDGSPPKEPVVVELDPFSAFRHATLVWHRADRWERAEIEAAIRAELSAIDSRQIEDRSSGTLTSWLLTVGVALGVFALFGVGLLVYFFVVAGRR